MARRIRGDDFWYYYYYYLNNVILHTHDYDKINETIKPYNARASAKINIKINPTNNLSYYAFPLTPTSPTIPIANPAAIQLAPQHNPDAICAKPDLYEYSNGVLTKIIFIMINLFMRVIQPQSYHRYPKYLP